MRFIKVTVVYEHKECAALIAMNDIKQIIPCSKSSFNIIKFYSDPEDEMLVKESIWEISKKLVELSEKEHQKLCTLATAQKFNAWVNRFVASQEDLPPEFAKILHDKMWDLLA